MSVNTAFPLFKPAQAEVLRILSLSRVGISLREICYRSSLQLRSVQLAIKALTATTLVLEQREGNRCCYSINPEHAFATFLQTMLAEKHTQHVQRADDTKVALRSLQALDAMRSFARKASGALRAGNEPKSGI